MQWPPAGVRLLIPQLQAVERRVAPALAQQLVVTAGFDHASVLDDEDTIGVDHRVQPVRDHDRRSSLAEMLDGALHLPLGFRIERSGGLVEQDDRGILEQRARDRDALALAAGEPRAVLAHRRIVPARKGLMKSCA